MGVSFAGQRVGSKRQTVRDSNSAVPKLILVSWIGHADLKAAEGEAGAGLGPIAQAVAFKDFARIVLLGDSPADRAQRYLEWLKARGQVLLLLEKWRRDAVDGAGAIRCRNSVCSSVFNSSICLSSNLRSA